MSLIEKWREDGFIASEYHTTNVCSGDIVINFQKIESDLKKLIDEEIETVRTVCIGLTHPDQAEQEKFTKWLQDTVVFHIRHLSKKIFGEEEMSK